MTNYLPQREEDHILEVISRFPGGASVADLLPAFSATFSKRTLQRRLDHLVSERSISPKGEGRARRYVLAYRSPVVSEPAPEYPRRGATSAHEWLSGEGAELRTAIQLPLARRMPVGYNSGFLTSYQPNKTAYLPESLRRELETIGQVGLSNLPAGTYLRQVLDRLLIDLSWNSSRLEGNTYSLLETRRLLELGEDAEGKDIAETQMILNHKAALEMLSDESSRIDFNRYTICNLHALLSDNLLPDPSAGGRIRTRPVGISGTVFHPLEVPQQIEECFGMILEKAHAITNPFEQSFFVMVHLPYLQPFDDVNKRVSRLAANIPLIRHNLCPLSFVDVEQQDYVGGLIAVYEQNRIEYLRDVFAWAYRRSCARYSAVRQSLGDPDPFRLRHRAEIGNLVRMVVHALLDKRDAARRIRTEVEKTVEGADRAKLIEVVETELENLREENIARYRLRPSEFEKWHATWR
ncbi:MAG: Fic family protein [Verrucomicrobiaceae bacterium]|nr:MAG: Fic family protein [Verrucomicrobiaceae bacterium]